MANIAIDRIARPIGLPPFGIVGRWRVLARYWRRQRLRRRAMRQVPGHSALLDDIGLAVPRRTPLERWAALMLDHRR